MQALNPNSHDASMATVDGNTKTKIPRSQHMQTPSDVPVQSTPAYLPIIHHPLFTLSQKARASDPLLRLCRIKFHDRPIKTLRTPFLPT